MNRHFSTLEDFKVRDKRKQVDSNDRIVSDRRSAIVVWITRRLIRSVSEEMCMRAQVDISPRFQSVGQRGEVSGIAVEVTADESRSWG